MRTRAKLDTGKSLALLSIALRVDMPLPKHFSDTALQLLLDKQVGAGYLYESHEGACLNLTESGKEFLVQSFGEFFVDKLHLLHNNLGFFIDHIYVVRYAEQDFKFTLDLVHEDLSNFSPLTAAVNEAMCEQARQLGGKRPWNTLTDLRDLGYYEVSKKKSAHVDWRYLWSEHWTSSSRVREYKGKRK